MFSRLWRGWRGCSNDQTLLRFGCAGECSSDRWPLVFYNFSDSLALSAQPLLSRLFSSLSFSPISFTFPVAVDMASLSLSLPHACCMRVHSPHACIFSAWYVSTGMTHRTRGRRTRIHARTYARTHISPSLVGYRPMMTVYPYKNFELSNA